MMRFETLDYESTRNTLRRLHKRLNKNLFGGELHEVRLCVENLDNPFSCNTPYPAFARFRSRDLMGNESISFDHSFADFLEGLETQREQVYMLTLVMLHEMIHQYCYENGIDDSGHGGEWSRIAEAHGLHSIFQNGEPVEEELRSGSLITAAMFRMY